MLTKRLDCRYETNLQLAASRLISRLCFVFVWYDSALLGKRTMDFHQKDMCKFRAEMLQDLQAQAIAIGISFALRDKHLVCRHIYGCNGII